MRKTKTTRKKTTTMELTTREMLEMAKITIPKIKEAKKKGNFDEAWKLTLRLAQFEVPLMDRWLAKGRTVDEWFELIRWHKDENIEQIIAAIDE